MLTRRTVLAAVAAGAATPTVAIASLPTATQNFIEDAGIDPSDLHEALLSIEAWTRVAARNNWGSIEWQNKGTRLHDMEPGESTRRLFLDLVKDNSTEQAIAEVYRFSYCMPPHTS
jgi:hypothetical protein